MKAGLLFLAFLFFVVSGHECEDDIHKINEEHKDLSCQCSHKENEEPLHCTCYTQQVAEDDEPHYLNCLDAKNNGETESGIYVIKPDDLLAFRVYCDMETDGGGWTVFQRRMDGSQDFYRNWRDYVQGFGELKGEFWLGLSKIHRLANSTDPAALRVDLKDYDNNASYAHYSSFYIGGSSTDHTLQMSGYSGTAGDSLARSSGMKFSTKDDDNDVHNNHCAVLYSGAWWYRDCTYSNLNGLYSYSTVYDNNKYAVWYHWKNRWVSIKFSEMKIRG